MSFIISHSTKDLALMEAILNFINELSEKKIKKAVTNLHISKTSPGLSFSSLSLRD